MRRPIRCSQHLDTAKLATTIHQEYDNGPPSATALVIMVQHLHTDVAAQASVH